MPPQVTVIGAGLAGSECAYQLAERGVQVRLCEQKPQRRTPAQQHDFFAELVCSNSLRGADLGNCVGLLKEEMRRAGSLILDCADATRVPAGGALAVDRERFGALVTERLQAHPAIEIVPGEVTAVPQDRPVVIATGPLTGDALAEDIARIVGSEHLAYYDAIAPIIAADSVDMDKVFARSRYDKGDPEDYINCPMDEPTYRAFVTALVEAEKVQPRQFEKVRYFEGCLPVETMAERGPDTLRYGPMKPVGLTDPRTGRWPFAVVQLRCEDRARTAFNLVGFQTRMKYPEQKRVFSMIPGLENVRFERYGNVHRNTFVDSPRALGDDFALHGQPGVYLAGQVSGVEGYVESAASGLVMGSLLAQRCHGHPEAMPAKTTALGSLMGHLRRTDGDFQPTNVVWSLFPPIHEDGKLLRKKARKQALSGRALQDLEAWLRDSGAADIRSRQLRAQQAAG